MLSAEDKGADVLGDLLLPEPGSELPDLATGQSGRGGMTQERHKGATWFLPL